MARTGRRNPTCFHLERNDLKMTVREKIGSFIRNRKMTIEERIEYLMCLYEDGLTQGWYLHPV